METSKSPAGSVKRHSRNVSRPLTGPRRSTRGPLDAADDPLAGSPVAPQSPSVASDVDSSRHSAELQQSEKPVPTVDLRFLQDSTQFEQIPTEDIPEAFLNSRNQPPAGTPLSDLLQNGHFRRGAEAALKELLQCSPEDAKHIFQLLYTRLACLILISRPDLASHEAVRLTELLSRSPPGASDIVPLIPWELRLLLVRLQSITAADGGRRGVMALYALAAEARARIADAVDAGREDELATWSGRLRDLGLRVADTLVEMGELETATRHLDTLVSVDGDGLAYRKGLLRLRVGDVNGAQRSIDKVQDSTRKASLEALMKVANGYFAKAVHAGQSHLEENPDNALSASNLAVALLYTGNIAQARQVLERLAQDLPPFAGLMFNLGTVYELCTEHAMERKMDLARNTAGKAPAPNSGGWEMADFEFKL